MREIEIKAYVRDVPKLLAALKSKNIKLSRPYKQHDVVYGSPGSKDNEYGANWLRIRTEDDSIVTFTLKRSVVGHLDSIEHETVVDNAKELESIVNYLGYELYSDLTKYRQKAQHNGIEICVDRLPGLGDFIEAELLMEDDADHDNVVAELWELLTSLGISKEDEAHLGYDVLERKKRGL